MILCNELHKYLMYNPWTGILYWKIKPAKQIIVNTIAGHKINGYIRIGLRGKEYLAHRLAWLFVYGYIPENDIAHIDRIRHHNWIKNLRESSRQCNVRNTGNYSTNTSGVKGVSWGKNEQSSGR